ncbi:MAG: CHAT domain-containing protein, partial [Alphaproteobacteria bacterium]
AGDLEGAEAALAQAESRMKEIRGGGSRAGRSEFLAFWEGAIRRARAGVLASRGKAQEADTEYAAALVLLDSYGNKELRNPDGRVTLLHQFRTLTRSERALSLLRLDRPIEAEIMMRLALAEQLSASGADSSLVSALLARLGQIVGDQGRTDDAVAIFKAVLDVQARTGVSNEALTGNIARAQLASGYMLKGNWREARAEADAVRRNLASDTELWQRRFGANPDMALIALKTGDLATAKDIGERYLSTATKRLGPRHYNTAEAGGVRAMILAAEGERKQALALFAQILPVLLSRSRQSQEDGAGGAVQAFRRGQILQGYLDLLATIAGTPEEREANLNAADAAFRIADFVRGQAVQQALAQSAARASVSDPALADLARREQDTQREISSLNGILAGLLSAMDGQVDAKAVQNLRVQVDTLRDERGKLAAEIEKRFPEYAELINPKPVGIEEARAVLRPGEALVAFYVGEKQSFVWAVPKDGEIAFARVALGADKLSDQVAVLRAALDPDATAVEDIPAFDVKTAYALYQALLQPVEKGWHGAKNLIVVPHGALGFLPISVLPTKSVPQAKDGPIAFASYRGVPWLARSHAVTMLPSVASLKSLRGLKAASPARQAFVGFGDPLFNAQQAAEASKDDAILTMRGGKVAFVRRNASRMAEADSTRLSMLPRLADTRAELMNIARALNADPAKDVFLGKEANTERVKTMALKDYRVIAFATHGLVPGELDGLTEPALAMTAPEIAGVPGNGLLGMADILALKIDADWIVLSACNTASGDGAGAEAVSGLGRAFFYAGTRAILATNWPVHSASAARLTADLFRRQAEDGTLGRAEALRQASLALIDAKGFEDQGTGREVFAYAHPLFWAPFSLYGDGG